MSHTRDKLILQWDCPGHARVMETTGDLKCWGAWDSTCGHKAKDDITTPIASVEERGVERGKDKTIFFLFDRTTRREGPHQSDQYHSVKTVRSVEGNVRPESSKRRGGVPRAFSSSKIQSPKQTNKNNNNSSNNSAPPRKLPPPKKNKTKNNNNKKQTKKQKQTNTHTSNNNKHTKSKQSPPPPPTHTHTLDQTARTSCSTLSFACSSCRINVWLNLVDIILEGRNGKRNWKRRNWRRGGEVHSGGSNHVYKEHRAERSSPLKRWTC